MKTNYPDRDEIMKRLCILITVWVWSILLFGCRQNNPDYGPIATTVAGQAEAVRLVGENDLQSVAPALWAISTASTTITPGTFMVINKVKDVAVFVAQGGTATNGSPYTFIGFVNVINNTIMDPTRAMAQLGINFSEMKTLAELKAALRNNGFIELTEKTAPSLLAVIRLAMGCLKTVGVGISTTLGATISDVLVVPAGILTPEYFYPWCEGGKGCQHVEQ